MEDDGSTHLGGSAESAESAESLDSEGCFVGCGMPRVVPLLVRLGLP